MTENDTILTILTIAIIILAVSAGGGLIYQSNFNAENIASINVLEANQIIITNANFPSRAEYNSNLNEIIIDVRNIESDINKLDVEDIEDLEDDIYDIENDVDDIIDCLEEFYDGNKTDFNDCFEDNLD